MAKFIFLLFSISIILLSCSPITVQHVSNIEKPKGDYLIYSLPINGLSFEIDIEERAFYKGPFAEYTTNFLGISNANNKDYKEYLIQGIKINRIAVPDAEHIYACKLSCKVSHSNFSLSENSIIYGLNYKPNNEIITTVVSGKKFNKSRYSDVIFSNLSNSGFEKEIFDTSYKSVLVDSSYIKVPVLKAITASKNEYDRASEAANHLMRIRKRKFKLLSGAYENMPNEGTIETIVKELNNEEQEYLSLFIGKTISNRNIYRNYFIPDNKNQTYLLGYFSENKGFSDTKKEGYTELSVEIKKLDNYASFNSFNNKRKENTKHKGLVYRIPEHAQINVKAGNKVIYSTQIALAQFGYTNVLPKNVLKKKFPVIEFCPITGNIIRIR